MKPGSRYKGLTAVRPLDFFAVLTGITAGSEARMVVVVVVVEAWRLELTQRLPENSTWLLNLKGIIALPTARNINEAAWAQ